MATFIFTFGSYHPKFAYKCVRITARTANAAKRQIEKTKVGYANQYSESEWLKRMEQSQRVSQPREQEITMEEVMRTISK